MYRKPTTQKDGLNHAVSIQDRFQQMTAQERLIQQKKLEIENKQMLKDQEDAMKLIEEKSKTEKKPLVFITIFKNLNIKNQASFPYTV